MNAISPMQPIDVSDVPFLPALDVVIDLPAPPSVNKVRKIDWSAMRPFKRWKKLADNFVLAAKCRTRDPVKLNRVPRFELHITMSEAHTGIDLDNGLKCLIDYLHAIELIENDAPKNLRRLVVEWGRAPEGCRVTVIPVSDHPSAGKTLGRHGATAQPGGPDQSAVPVRKARGMIGGVA